jgi:hypothetical protein
MADKDVDRTDEQQQGTFDTERGRSANEPMNDAQRRYLKPLTESQNEQVKDDMTEAQAAATIDRLQENAASVY